MPEPELQNNTDIPKTAKPLPGQDKEAIQRYLEKQKQIKTQQEGPQGTPGPDEPTTLLDEKKQKELDTCIEALRGENGRYPIEALSDTNIRKPLYRNGVMPLLTETCGNEQVAKYIAQKINTIPTTSLTLFFENLKIKLAREEDPALIILLEALSMIQDKISPDSEGITTQREELKKNAEEKYKAIILNKAKEPKKEKERSPEEEKWRKENMLEIEKNQILSASIGNIASAAGAILGMKPAGKYTNPVPEYLNTCKAILENGTSRETILNALIAETNDLKKAIETIGQLDPKQKKMQETFTKIKQVLDTILITQEIPGPERE